MNDIIIKEINGNAHFCFIFEKGKKAVYLGTKKITFDLEFSSKKLKYNFSLTIEWQSVDAVVFEQPMQCAHGAAERRRMRRIAASAIANPVHSTISPKKLAPVM